VTARDALAQVKRDLATCSDPDAPVREVLAAASTIVAEHAPALVEALEAVLAIHQKHPDSGQGYDADGNYVEFVEVCQACGQYDEYAVPWPCPTVAAVETALEGR
jgi:hypothetical protein